MYKHVHLDCVMDLVYIIFGSFLPMMLQAQLIRARQSVDDRFGCAGTMTIFSTVSQLNLFSFFIHLAVCIYRITTWRYTLIYNLDKFIP